MAETVLLGLVPVAARLDSMGGIAYTQGRKTAGIRVCGVFWCLPAGRNQAHLTGGSNPLQTNRLNKKTVRLEPRWFRRGGENMKGQEMFAVIKTGGKQYQVAANDVIQIEKLEGEAGAKIQFTEVLVVGEGASAKIGAPFVDGAVVTAEVVEQGRTRKTISFVKRRRQNSKRKKGHRQHFTKVRILEIAA
jgi:large subunit ribosomal protein L21